MAAAVLGRHRLRHALTLVVAAADANGVHVAPIALNLRMHQRVAVDFARRSMQHLRSRVASEIQAVLHPVDRRPERLQRIALVVDWRGRASEIVDFVELASIRLRDVPLDKREAVVRQQVGDIPLRPREEVVEALHLVAFIEKAFAEVGSEESGASGYKSFFREDNAHGKIV